MRGFMLPGKGRLFVSEKGQAQIVGALGTLNGEQVTTESHGESAESGW